MSARDAGRDEEITAARLDRELNELLQELRVAQNGVLLLVGFLLVIPFSARWHTSPPSEFERVVYYITLLSAGLNALVIIAPVAIHRMLFRKHEKAAIVQRGHELASVGLLLLAATILGVLVLVTNFLFGTVLTISMSAVYVPVVSLLWLAMPLHAIRHRREEAESSSGSPPPNLRAALPK